VLGRDPRSAAVIRVDVPGRVAVQRASAQDHGQFEALRELVERVIAVQREEHQAVGAPGAQHPFQSLAAPVGVGQQQHEHQVGLFQGGVDPDDDVREEGVREQARVVV
jgi:hypothetical protein